MAGILSRWRPSWTTMWYAAAIVLVLIRCAPSLWFEQFDFDSDQAIVGLMAKHLVEGRTFPLFFYGQNYMLGVEAWIAAPFVAAMGPTVAAVRLPLLLINLVVVLWLMRRLIDRGIAPGLAFVAALPFIAPGALASMLLMQTLGASVEPFLYVLLLWFLRRRPIAFGAVFALAYLHREFVLFALPAMLVVWWLERRTATESAGAFVAKAAAAFAAVWIAVEAIARRTNTLGPSGGEFSPGSLVAQSQMVMMRLAWSPRPYVSRLTALVSTTLPDLFAARPVPAWLVGVKSQLALGSTIGGVAFAVAMLIGAALLLRRGDRQTESPNWFYLYLGLIAVQTVLAYPLNGGLDPHLPGVTRYVLFALLGPLAIVGACVAQRRRPAWIATVVVAITVWSGLNVVDGVRLLHEYVTAPPPANHLALANALIARRIRYGRADYWDAYIVDFLSRERVILAPTRVSRISSYDARVERNEANAVTIVHEPCDNGVRVALWCIDDPLHRQITGR